MRCNLENRNQVIEDYLNGRLAEADREAFDEHCFNCDICYRELRLREEMIATIKQDGATIFARQITAQRSRAKNERKSLFRSIFPAATLRPAFAVAALALIAVVSGLIMTQMKQQPGVPAEMISEKQESVPSRPSEPDQTPTQPQKPTTKPKKPDFDTQLYAANFEPLPMFEEMLSATVRSSAIVVITPQAGQKVESGNIRFQWQAEEAGPFYVKIMSNRGRQVVSVRTTDSTVTVTQKLAPGLYYWKLETEEDLLYLGKFLIPVSGER